MKKHIKLLIPTILVLALVVFVGVTFFDKPQKPQKIVYLDAADSIINLNDPREVVGISQYVFVGYVEETYDYYTENSERVFPQVIEYFDREFTECSVKVVSNIKGELEEGKTFSFYKVGGITKDKEYIVLESGDITVEKGKYYIFTGYAHPDGTVTGGGTNGTIKLEDGISENNLSQSKLYKAYTDAYKSEILPEYNSPDYYAKADKNYGDGSYNANLYYKENAKADKTDEKYYTAVKSGNTKIK